MGDLNINMLCDTDRRTLDDVLDVYDMKNIITSTTCFKLAEKPTLLNVIITTSNASKIILNMINLNIGISDFHHVVGFITKLQLPRKDKIKIIYRSYKGFDAITYKRDMSYIPHHVGEVFDDTDDRASIH